MRRGKGNALDLIRIQVIVNQVRLLQPICVIAEDTCARLYDVIRKLKQPEWFLDTYGMEVERNVPSQVMPLLQPSDNCPNAVEVICISL